MAKRKRLVEAKHFKPLPGGGYGCWTCGAPATRWIDFHPNGPDIVRVAEACCDDHPTGPRGPHTTIRPIRRNTSST